MLMTAASSVLSVLAAAWIYRRSRRYRAGAMPGQSAPARALTPGERATLTRYFSAELLENVRLAPVEYIKPFWMLTPKLLRRIGAPLSFDLSRYRGMAYADTIVIAGSHKPVPIGIVFHELVHVVQYRRLGVRRMLRGYLADFLRTGDYFEIHAERQAYALQDRFDSGRGEPFSVEEVVAAELT
jgi:hypothetical protein